MAIQPDATGTEARRPRRQAPAGGRRALPRARILIVDDDEPLRTSIAEALVEAGFEIETCGEGRSGFRALRSSRFDLVVLDLRMPVMSGWEFRALQREESGRAAIPVLAISADGSPEARAISADGYLRKPFGFDQLLGAVERILLEAHTRKDETRAAEVQRVAALTRLAAGVGHEINNPLTYASFNTRLLLERARSADRALLEQALCLGDVPELLDEAVEGLGRIATVVRSLQNLVSRTQDVPDEVELEALLDDSLTALEEKIPAGSTVERNYGPAALVIGRGDKIRHMLVHLVANAIESLDPGSDRPARIRLATYQTDTNVCVRISDTGRGIPPEILPHVFEPFFTTQPVGTGKGLGLAICREIAGEHGGSVEIESEPGVGTTVSVYFPVAAVAQSSSALPRLVREGEPSKAEAPSPARPRVLVIDDEPLVQRMLERALRLDHVVVSASSAAEARALIEEGERFDVILCDLIMPDAGGFEFRDTLLALAPEQAESLVFMTGGMTRRGAPGMDEYGAHVVLQKPFDLHEVRRLVQAASARRQGA